ncbi:4Fe-4S dicluster domain-containing protein [Fibrobacterota bacterium]
MEDKSITLEDFKKLPSRLKELGYAIIAPAKQGDVTLFSEISSYDEYDGDCLKTQRSIKEVMFPRTEKICNYTSGGAKGIELQEIKGYANKTVVLGCRPCDAASLPIMDKVFEWDYKDNFYIHRRRESVIVSMACGRFDEFCMCTSLGCSPVSEQGSDILLMKRNDNAFHARVITDKGRGLVEMAGELFKKSDEQVPQGIQGPEVKADPEKIKQWLDMHFEDELWDALGMRCIGCGTCAYVCPTCHCFDIIDEGNLKKGSRVKNWDACGFGLFTKHASGHNPRSSQDKRYRQRIMHKFKMYVDKFNVVSCVGCGRCSSSCPVDLNIMEILKTISVK